MKDRLVEDLIASLDNCVSVAAAELEHLEAALRGAQFCYNLGRGKWKDVFFADLHDGQLYLIRRVMWKSMKRRSVAHADRPVLARWSRSGWQFTCYGNVRSSTASLEGIQVYG